MSSEYPVMAAGRARLAGIPMINKEVVLPHQCSDAPIMALWRYTRVHGTCGPVLPVSEVRSAHLMLGDLLSRSTF